MSLSLTLFKVDNFIIEENKNLVESDDEDDIYMREYFMKRIEAEMKTPAADKIPEIHKVPNIEVGESISEIIKESKEVKKGINIGEADLQTPAWLEEILAPDDEIPICIMQLLNKEEERKVADEVTENVGDKNNQGGVKIEENAGGFRSHTNIDNNYRHSSSKGESGRSDHTRESSRHSRNKLTKSRERDSSTSPETDLYYKSNYSGRVKERARSPQKLDPATKREYELEIQKILMESRKIANDIRIKGRWRDLKKSTQEENKKEWPGRQPRKEGRGEGSLDGVADIMGNNIK